MWIINIFRNTSPPTHLHEQIHVNSKILLLNIDKFKRYKNKIINQIQMFKGVQFIGGAFSTKMSHQGSNLFEKI